MNTVNEKLINDVINMFSGNKNLHPKYSLGDNVEFDFNDEHINGTIVVVDRGIFGDMSHVYYDIMVESGDWYKHILEDDVKLK